ncbi:hypothetical protein KIPB_007384, partial [Kipferlia bialata]
DNSTFVTWGPTATVRNRPMYTLASADGPVIVRHTLQFDRGVLDYALSSKPVAMPANGLIRLYTVGTFDYTGQYLMAGTTSGEAVVFSMDRDTAMYRVCVKLGGAPITGICQLVDAPSCPYVIGSGAGVTTLTGRDRSWQRSETVPVPGGALALQAVPNEDRVCILTGRSALMTLDSSLSTPMALSVATDTGLGGVCFGAKCDVVYVGTRLAEVQAWSLGDYSRLSCVGLVSGRTAAGKRAECTCICHFEDTLYTGWSNGLVSGHAINPNGTIGSQILTLTDAHRGSIESIHCNETGLATCGGDATIRVWDTSREGYPELKMQLAEHSHRVTALKWDLVVPSILHSVGSDGELVCSDIAKGGARVKQWRLTSGGMGCAQIQSGHAELCVLTEDGSVGIYDFDLPQPVLGAHPPLGVVAGPTGCIAVGESLIVTAGTVERERGDVSHVTVHEVTEDSVHCVASVPLEGILCTDVCLAQDQKQVVVVGSLGEVVVLNYYGST